MRSLLIATLVTLSFASGARACPGGLDGTFIQLQDAQLRWGRAEWSQALEGLRSLGISTVIVQYTGDPDGPFDARYGTRSIEHLLVAAERAHVEVWLGLDHAPRWPDVAPPTFAPLADELRTAALARSCARRSSCVGFYLSPEIDDFTWSQRTSSLRALLIRAVHVLRARMPHARISAAPFFTRHLSPAEHARFMARLFVGTGIDVVMLQGGTGTGRASPSDARMYYRALEPLLREHAIDTWLVVELFDQLAGAPWDERAFAARPASIAAARRALLVDEPRLEHRVAFSVLDYMSGTDLRAIRLRADYRAFCRRRTRSVAERAGAR